MSQWTYITGVIKVNVPGYTKAHKAYVLDTVLHHLPQVTGSEQNMRAYPTWEIPRCSSWSSMSRMYENEFGEFVPRHNHEDGDYVEYDGLANIVVSGDLRDRDISRTYQEFMKFLCRLSKRLYVKDVVVQIRDSWEDRIKIITNENDVFGDMFEYDCDEDSKNWCNFMMWKREDSGLPLTLENQYKKYETR